MRGVKLVHTASHRNPLDHQAPSRTHIDLGRYFRLIHDRVTVALFGEEKLPVMGEVHFSRVSADKRVEVRRFRAILRPENSAQTLGFFLAASERAGNLDHDVRVW